MQISAVQISTKQTWPELCRYNECSLSERERGGEQTYWCSLCLPSLLSGCVGCWSWAERRCSPGGQSWCCNTQCHEEQMPCPMRAEVPCGMPGRHTCTSKIHKHRDTNTHWNLVSHAHTVYIFIIYKKWDILNSMYWMRAWAWDFNRGSDQCVFVETVMCTVFCMLKVYVCFGCKLWSGACMIAAHHLVQASEHEQCLCVVWQEPQVEEYSSICWQQSSGTLLEFPGMVWHTHTHTISRGSHSWCLKSYG